MQELLFAQATARTPYFDDYTEGSYHVDKIDLLEGVRAVREDEHVVGLVAYGPVGPLWAYHVLLFVAEDDSVRLNTLVFSHARITGKATRLLSRKEYDDVLGRLSSRPAMVAGAPTLDALQGGQAADVDLPLEWRYSLMMADWSTGTERLWHSAGDERTLSADEVVTLTSDLNEFLEGSTTTYTTTLPDGYESNICPDEP